MGIGREINLENIEEEKLSGFDYGLDVLRFAARGAVPQRQEIPD